MKIKKQVKIIQDVIEMVSGYFNLDIEVKISTGKMPYENDAETDIECEGFYSMIFNSHFLRSASDSDIVRIAAHEMVHIKQYELDGLDLTDEGLFFKGVEWSGDYWFSPCEIEARGYELAFLSHYLESEENKEVGENTS